MKSLKRSIILGGITLAGLAIAGYRVYELRKLRSVQEEVVIEIEPEVVKDTQK